MEVLFTPVTNWMMGRLKQAESVDVYDTETRFTPFSLQDEGESRESRIPGAGERG